MEQNTLGEVIEAEKRIHERLEEEKRRAERYLREVREDSARELENAERCLRDTLDGALREAEAEALLKAEAVKREARELRRKLQALEETELKRLVLKHIAAILPEAP